MSPRCQLGEACVHGGFARVAGLQLWDPERE